LSYFLFVPVLLICSGAARRLVPIGGTMCRAGIRAMTNAPQA